MRHGELDDPLLRQVLPLDAEMQPVPGFGLDAVGDAAARTASGVIQKYRGRALLIATGSCAVHCRYCFRRHFPYAEETAARDGWREAVAAIAADPGIDEVLLSGGDPLSLATPKLVELTDALAAIPHLKRLRIHSRLPVVVPARVDAPLLAWLRGLPWPVAFVIHANHANEFDAEVDTAMQALRGAGAQLLNQAVLLRGVNDSVAALAALSERSFAMRRAAVLPAPARSRGRRGAFRSGRCPRPRPACGTGHTPVRLPSAPAGARDSRRHRQTTVVTTQFQRIPP